MVRPGLRYIPSTAVVDVNMLLYSLVFCTFLFLSLVYYTCPIMRVVVVVFVVVVVVAAAAAAAALVVVAG